MFSKLLSFFIPKDDNFVNKDELDLLINTVSKGFQAHRDKLMAIEQTSAQTDAKFNSFDSRLSQLESNNNEVDDIRSAVLATQGQQQATENSIAKVSENINHVQDYAKSGFSDLMQHITSLNARLEQMESQPTQSFLTRADLESYHATAKESLDSRLNDLATELKRQTA